MRPSIVPIPPRVSPTNRRFCRQMERMNTQATEENIVVVAAAAAAAALFLLFVVVNSSVISLSFLLIAIIIVVVVVDIFLVATTGSIRLMEVLSFYESSTR